jgi:hypothetical protein
MRHIREKWRYHMNFIQRTLRHWQNFKVQGTDIVAMTAESSFAPLASIGAHANFDALLFLSGQIAAANVRRMERLHTLADAEFKVCSQWGEDGIIEWLCHFLPDIPRSFIEFGVEDYHEANTRFLLQNRGWKGLVIDGSASYMQRLRSEPLYWKHDVTAVSAFITAENIDALICEHDFAGPLGILSVDIDGVDYWVLKAIKSITPAIIICEINGVFGDLRAITVPYDPGFDRLQAHHSGQYFGCSIAALKLLCKERGYTYLGTNSNGVNAFFVRNDLAGEVGGRIETVRTWPPRHRDSRDAGGSLSFQRGLAKTRLIANMPVVDLEGAGQTTLRALEPLYSDAFLIDYQ